MKFNYSEAFSRNIGWVTDAEQQRLRSCRVAIAGMGGVGGVHLLTLARLGLGSFHLADFDHFELHNFNRQSGAFMSSLGQAKVEVMKRQLLDINPEAEVKVFAQGIHPQNMDEFLTGADLYVDGLDAFALDIRAQTFAACREKKIPAVTVAPVGLGFALMSFAPNSMSFEDYFGFSNHSSEEKFYRLILGLTPKFLHLKALVDRSRLNAEKKIAPSTPMGCQMAAGVMGSEALKILLGRGPLLSAPRSLQYDPYTYRLRVSHLPWGHRNPLFQLKLFILKKIFQSKA